eukprot:2914903-Lingulodinium_polyedra.AAC.1
MATQVEVIDDRDSDASPNKIRTSSNCTDDLQKHGLTQESLMAILEENNEEVAEKISHSVEQLSQGGFFERKATASPVEEETQNDAEAEFWKAVKETGFEVPARADKGRPIAARWQRRLTADPKLKKDYAALTGRAQKAEFRKQWAKGQYDTFVEKKTYTQQQQNTESMEGTMLSLHRIAVEEGGGKAGMRAAVNYALTCLQQASPAWVEYNSWTKSVKFRYVVKKSTDTFTKSWSATQQWKGSGTGSTCEEEKQQPQRTKAKAKAATKKRAAKEVEAAEAGTPSKKAVTELQQARKTKSTYTSTTSQVDMVLRSIDTDASWAWANNSHMLEGLREARKTLAEMVDADDNIMKLLVMDFNEVKTMSSPDMFEKSLRNLTVKLEPPLRDLQRE